MALSPPVAGPTPRHQRRATPAALADALENPRDDFDRLIGDLRLATRFDAPAFDRFEGRAQMVAAAIVAAFRGAAAPSAAPLSFETDGRTSSAFY